MERADGCQDGGLKMEAAGKLCELPLLDCVQRGCFLFFLSTRMMIFPSVISLSFPSGAHGRHPRFVARTVAPRLVLPLVVLFGITACTASGTCSSLKEKKRATFFLFIDLFVKRPLPCVVWRSIQRPFLLPTRTATKGEIERSREDPDRQPQARRDCALKKPANENAE